MNAPRPQTIGSELSDRLQQLALSAGGHQRVQDFAAEFLHDCEKLQGIDVIEASLLKSSFYALAGDKDKSDYWLRNATNNGGAKERITACREANLFIMGYISDAYLLFKDAYKGRTNTNSLPFLYKALSCGWFRFADWILEQIDPSSIPPEVRLLVTQGLETVNNLDLTDEQICSVMDEAHSLMRDRNLIWLDHIPSLKMSGESDKLLCITYRVSISPEEASELTWRLIDRLIDRNLDSLGLVVGFQGTVVTSGVRSEVVMS